MGKLKQPPARLGAAPGRISGAAVAPDREARRRASKPWRAWYGLARWRELRGKIVARAGGMCEACDPPHAFSGARHHPQSPVIDHIIPHKGDPALFWDEGNLQAVCKAWHDSEKQREERENGFL